MKKFKAHMRRRTPIIMLRVMRMISITRMNFPIKLWVQQMKSKNLRNHLRVVVATMLMTFTFFQKIVKLRKEKRNQRRNQPIFSMPGQQMTFQKFQSHYKEVKVRILLVIFDCSSATNFSISSAHYLIFR